MIAWLYFFKQTKKGVSRSIYIDSYSVKIEGEDHKAKGKVKPMVNKLNMSSKDGMNSKAFIDMVEQIGDSHDSHCDIHIDVIMKQHRY